MSQSANEQILTINAGSSSIKFALFETTAVLHRVLTGSIERIGLAGARLHVVSARPEDSFTRALVAADHTEAVAIFMDWIGNRRGRDELAAVGHRVVHGGLSYGQPAHITRTLIHDLHGLCPLAPEHLPQEIQLIEAIERRFPTLAQVACFDTAFHRELPRVAQLLPLPRRYDRQGLRRFGFHGLSYQFLLEELNRLAGAEVAQGRLVLAHLGNGASLAAVHRGASVDTTMGFTPAAGIPMSTRSGDIDPGLVGYLGRTENLDPQQFSDMTHLQSGLLGVSELSSDMHELLDEESKDVRAAEAIELFCYQAKKWIGALAAALGGLDTLVFAGGIGENAATVRARICDGLGFLGIAIHEQSNAANAAVISKKTAAVVVRVMHTDEEVMIARSVCRLLNIPVKKETAHE